MDQALTIEGCDNVTSDRSVRGDTIGRLFDLHHARLYRMALRMTWGADDAADLVQECFLRAVEHEVPADPLIAERWLTRVLVNLCRDRRRRGQVRRAHEGAMPNGVAAVRHDPDAAAALRDAVRKLPVRQLAVVVLHEIEGRPLREVAETLGIAAVTARWHLHTALRALRKELSR